MRVSRGRGRSGDPAVYFLSDYGTVDEFVGVVHAVLHHRAPNVPVVDLGHQLPPFDVGAGAAMLVRCAPSLGAGVVLAVVDPGVGTDRRGVAVEASGRGPSWLVGPDNGLLGPLADALGGARRVLVLRSPGGPRGTAGPAGRTFDGRDLFAPAAAHLVLRRPPDEIGDEVDPASLTPVGEGPPDRAGPGDGAGPDPAAARGPRGPAGTATGLESVVTWIDRFGNAQLGAGPGALVENGVDAGSGLLVTLPGPPARSRPARWVGAFGDLDSGELGLLVDSSGQLALVLCRASAAAYLGVAAGDTVWLAPERPA